MPYSALKTENRENPLVAFSILFSGFLFVHSFLFCFSFFNFYNPLLPFFPDFPFCRFSFHLFFFLFVLKFVVACFNSLFFFFHHFHLENSPTNNSGFSHSVWSEYEVENAAKFHFCMFEFIFSLCNFKLCSLFLFSCYSSVFLVFVKREYFIWMLVLISCPHSLTTTLCTCYVNAFRNEGSTSYHYYHR